MKTQDTEQVDRTVGCFVNKLSARRQAKFSSSPSLSYDGRTQASWIDSVVGSPLVCSFALGLGRELAEGLIDVGVPRGRLEIT